MKKSTNPDAGCIYLISVIIICMLILGLCSRSAPAQGAVYTSYHPVDHGIGLRADFEGDRGSKSVFKRVGTYYGASYGNWGLYRLYGLEHHIKVTAGILIPLKPYYKWHYNLSIGTNYHHLGKGYEINYQVNPKIYQSWSYEVGLSVRMKKIAVCMATDIRRWEPGVGLGLLF